jgi:hypothetical protein
MRAGDSQWEMKFDQKSECLCISSGYKHMDKNRANKVVFVIRATDAARFPALY